MAGQTSVTVRVVSNRLPSIPAAARAQIAGSVSKHAHDIVAAAQAKAPVRTGTLRRSIHAVIAESGLSAQIGPSVEYGIFVELGSRGRAARPFLRPAFELVAPRFADDVKSILAGL
jgi:HK97 gp10 family phage protein